MPRYQESASIKTAEPSAETLVGFIIGDEEYAIDIMGVQEILRTMPITKVPNLPSFIEGVISLRGNIVPVIFLRKRLGFSMQDVGESSRIIIAEVGENIVGLVVDQVTAVINLSKTDIKPPTPLMTQLKSKYVRGVGKLGERLIILLDIAEILTSQEINIMSKIKYEKEV